MNLVPPRSAWIVLSVCSLMVLAGSPFGQARELTLYIGTYTGGGSEGIYVTQFDTRTGALQAPRLAVATPNPSFLAIHPDGKHLYAVGELGEFRGQKAGAVSAFRIDRRSGGLQLLNQQSSRGDGPCHLSLDRRGRHVLVANYGGGSAAVLPLLADHSLGAATGFVQHRGSSVNPDRQKEPHAHSIHLDPGNRFAFVADLGLDRILVYQFDRSRGTITPHSPAYTAVKPGAGPRHFAFAPSGRVAYVINELDSTVTPLEYQPATGILVPRKSVSTLPPGFSGNSSCAEVVVHPDKPFVYGSNRGHDSIAVFRADRSGDLVQVEVEPTGGRTPRNFCIDPSGRFLLAANQSSNSITVFRIDRDTGALDPTPHRIETPRPVCLRFLP